MITFLALQPDPVQARHIATWRETSFPPLDHPVHVADLHITLVYLGETRDWQLEQLLQRAADLHPRPFRLQLDQIGYWPKPRVLWLGTSQIPTPLAELESQLSRMAGALGLHREKRSYQPHLTLARKLDQPPLAPDRPPDFVLEFDHFVLLESCRGPRGVHYHRLESFR